MTKRRYLTQKAKEARWEALQGLCVMCRLPVAHSGPETIWDHFSALWISGDNSDANFFPIHADPCNKIKTRQDHKTIAKTKRQATKHEGTFRKKGRKLEGRGFDKRLRRKFSGEVVKRD